MKIITTVGASLFENCNKQKDCALLHYRTLKNKNAKWNDYIEEINDLKEFPKFNEWIRINSKTACAEISSLVKIQKELLKENQKMVEVRLLATDTILSRLAGEIIRDEFAEVLDDVEVKFEPDGGDVIKELSLDNAGDFEEKGLPNLVARLNDLGINNENIIVNITGGYKGVIPFLTILGQMNEKSRIMYLYEDSDKIITIPRLPINFDAGFAEDYSVYLDSDYLVFPENQKVNEELEKYQLVESNGNRLRLLPAGMLLKQYIDRNTVFLTKTTMGYSFELLSFEYYQKKYSSEYEVQRGVKQINEFSVGSDIDIFLTGKEGAVAASVKAFNKIRNDKVYLSHTKSQFEGHISFFADNNIPLLSYHQIVYLYKNRSIQEILEKLRDMKSILEKKLRGAKYELFFIEIPVNRKDPYQSLFQNGLNENSTIKSYTV